MSQKIKIWIATTLGVLCLFTGPALMVAAPVHAQLIDNSSTDEACRALGASGCGDSTSNAFRITVIVQQAINILSIVVGIAAVIMIIIAGLRYVMSGGDSAGVSGAKSTIIYAVIGLAVAAGAQMIVRLVLSRVSRS